MKPKIQRYPTAEEHRAYIEGASWIINYILKEAAELWKLGREDIDLASLRDAMIKHQIELSEHVKASHELMESLGKNRK